MIELCITMVIVAVTYTFFDTGMCLGIRLQKK